MPQMKSLVVTSPSAEPQLTTAPIPTPEPSEIQISIDACALNFADLLIMKGKYQDTPSFPLTPGIEVAGTITAVGADVDQARIGDHVIAQVGHGGLAEFVVCDAGRAVPLPSEMPAEIGAALQVVYGTSHLALVGRARLQPGERLVVLGAGGGVGLAAIEIGAAIGATVIAVATGTKKTEAARKAGAHHVVDLSEVADLRSTLLEFGRSDVVYDHVGGEVGLAAQRTLQIEGRHLLIGFASGDLPELKPNHLLVKNLDVIGVNWSAYVSHRPDIARNSVSRSIDMWLKNQIFPHIGARYSLDEAVDALHALRDRKVTGKIVVTP